MPDFLGPGDERAVTRDLVMLDGLSTADNRGIEHLAVVHLAGNLVGLLDKTVDCGTVDAPGCLTEFREDLLEPGNLAFGFAQMTAKPGREFAIGSLLDHLGECLYDLVLGVKDIPQRVQEKVVHGFDVFAKEAHLVSPIAKCDQENNSCGRNHRPRGRFRDVVNESSRADPSRLGTLPRLRSYHSKQPW